MSENNGQLFVKTIENNEETTELIGKLFDVSNANAVLSDPISEGEYSTVVASELMVSMGAGFGSGYSEVDGGGGGGGGGFSSARPVAAIEIGPNGVRVEPIVDVTKVGLAAIATIGGIILAWTRVLRIAKSV